MYVSDASQITNLQDSASKGQSSQTSKPKFSVSEYTKKDSKETKFKDAYVKKIEENMALLNTKHATQTTAYSILNTQKTNQNIVDSKNSFIQGLLEQGYMEDEAVQRANIYQSSGLLTNLSSFGSIFDLGSSDFASTTLNPSYQKALRDAFDQMDVNQLARVSSELDSRFSFNMEELKQRIPQNLQVSDALLKGFDNYTGYQFGSAGKLFEMLGKISDQADTMERLTGVDQTELKDGINKVIDAYKRTLTI